MNTSDIETCDKILEQIIQRFKEHNPDLVEESRTMEEYFYKNENGLAIYYIFGLISDYKEKNINIYLLDFVTLLKIQDVFSFEDDKYHWDDFGKEFFGLK